MSARAASELGVAVMVRALIRTASVWALAVALPVPGLIALATLRAAADELTGSERAALARRVDDFATAMRDGKVEALVDVLPPRMGSYIAERRHISVDALHRSMVEQMQKIEASGAITAFDIDLARARYETLPDGTPYVLIPTDTDLQAKGLKIRKHTNTLAFTENGAWYFARINTPALVDRLVAVYPHFAGIDFGGETTTVVP